MRNKFKKPIMLMLVLTMLVSVFASYPIVGSAATTPDDDPTDYQKFTTENGQIAVEWEKVIVRSGGARVEAAKEASGRNHLRLNGTNTTKPTADIPGEAGFELTYDQGGKYIVWVRYMTLNGGTDSFWIDYGAAEYRTHELGYSKVDLTEHSEDETDYLWKRIGTVQMKEGETKKIRVSFREPGCVVDKIIITKAASFTPEGTGKLPDPSEMNAVAKLPEDRYPIPTITPTVGQHPRVFFTADDIPQIIENMKAPEMKEAVDFFYTYKEKDYSGQLTGGDPNYSPEGLEIIAAKALDYALFGNEENGREAFSAVVNYANTLDVSSAGDKCRQIGHALKIVGQVYDWCHPLLSADEKRELMQLAQMLSLDMEVGFPPDAQGMICGHGAEHQLYRDWLAMAIACYDEYPDAYNMVAGKIFTADSVDYRNWWNQSGTHSQGSYYPLQIRYKAELYAHILIKKMSGGTAELFNEEDLANIAYEWVYRRRPDGLIFIDGDDNNPNANVKKNRYTGAARDVLFLASTLNKSPALKKEFFYEGGFKVTLNREAVQPIDMLVLNDPSIDINTTLHSLPLTTYHASPVGEMIARTGWDMGVNSPDVVATMTLTEYNPMNHGHFDCGHFMIYYKGALAHDSGWYEQHGSYQQRNYMQQSVAHNTLVIETEYNKWGNQNQGIDGPKATSVDTSDGKNFYWIPKDWNEYQADEQNHWAEIMGHEFGPDIQYPEYSYLAGDLAKAYTSDYDDGVNEAIRHMIFLPTGDEKNPAAFIVFDKIDTKVGGKKKAFLLHSEEEPEVKGNVTTIKRTQDYYNGKLVNQTLLPAADNLTIDKIGGAEFDDKGKVIAGTDKRFWNRGQNFPFIQDNPDITLTADTSGRRVNSAYSLEAGWGRVEIMPTKSDKVDYMLNVMYVGDADDKSAVEKATLIETDSFAGAKIFDRVAMFSKAKARTKDTVTFVVPGSEEALKINVAGLEAGTWNVNVNGNNIGTQISSEEGGIIYFTAPAGSVTLTYVSGDANKTFTQSAPPQLEGVTLYVEGNFIYSDVPPTIRDGRTLIPMRALLETMNANVTWDEASATATANDGMTEIKITENQKTAYVDGKPVELDVPAMIIDGRFVIPVRFIAETFGAQVGWNDNAKRVEITIPKSQKDMGIANLIRIVATEQSGAEANAARQITASCDGDFSSYWGVTSQDHDAWGIYDFGSVKKLDKVMFSFMQGAVRKYKFDILVSTDGTNYTPVLTGMETSGTFETGKLEPFDLGGVSARYVKYKGYGNSVNMWNSLAEIVFTEKK